MAVPISVRRMDFPLPTDQTMATRGSGSGASNIGYIPFSNGSIDGRYIGMQADSMTSIRTLPGDKRKRSFWAKVRGKVRKIFGRKKMIG